MKKSTRPLDWMEALPADVRLLVDKLKSLPDFPLRLAQFAQVLRRRIHEKEALALDLACRAWTLSPGDPRVRLASAWAIRKHVPGWHFSILQDSLRNELYEKALRLTVTPDKTVLEIGTGTGILAMLAARAGAKHVYTCEMETLIADAARENIAKNGFEDRITVIAKSSTELVVGEDLPEPVDLLVSEIVDNGLLRESLLPVLEDARTRLVKPAATVIPSCAAMRGVLVGGSKWMKWCQTGEVLGLDLSAFDRFRPPLHAPSPDGKSLDDALSPIAEVFRFDFTGKCHFPAEKKVLSIPVIRDGMADAFLQWIWLDLGGSLELENKPPVQWSWNPQLHVFAHSIPVRAGDILQLAAEHDRHVATIYPVTEYSVRTP
jgi:hypothetical protein